MTKYDIPLIGKDTKLLVMFNTYRFHTLKINHFRVILIVLKTFRAYKYSPDNYIFKNFEAKALILII